MWILVLIAAVAIGQGIVAHADKITLPVAIVLAALMIAVGLLFHGRNVED